MSTWLVIAIVYGAIGLLLWGCTLAVLVIEGKLSVKGFCVSFPAFLAAWPIMVLCALNRIGAEYESK